MAVNPPLAPRPIAPGGRARRAAVGTLIALALLVGLAAPASALLTGVDVASHQHPGGAPIDWRQVKAAGHTFAYVKATEGTGYTNPYFSADWAGAGAAGLLRGAYHYAKPGLPLSTATDQARYFVSRAGSQTGAVDLPGVLDLEETGGLGQADLAQWTRIFLAEVQRLTGKPPMLYTGYYFWQDNLGNPTDIGRAWRLWLPSYPSDPNSTTFKPLVPVGWSTWHFWQYTSAGSTPGISGNVDLNRFCCDFGTLAALTGGAANAGSPFGSFDGATPTWGGVNVAGWAIDPDSTGPIEVHVYAGSAGAPLLAGQSRPDVGAMFTGFGNTHGYSGFVPTGTGPQQLCAYAINAFGGTNTPLGCRTVFVPTGDPIGVVDRADGTLGGIDVAGWALDPNTSASIPVHVYVDGKGVAATANVPRPDVGGAFPGLGANHGYSVRVPAAPGAHSVCTYGIDAAPPGGNSVLGCRTVVVPDGTPVGVIDEVGTIYGIVHVSGWTVDPDDVNRSTQVHVYVNGVGGAFTADLSRPDVGRAFGGSDRHGYDLIVPRVGSGPNTVCAYAINAAGTGGNRLLGCRTV